MRWLKCCFTFITIYCFKLNTIMAKWTHFWYGKARLWITAVMQQYRNWKHTIRNSLLTHHSNIYRLVRYIKLLTSMKCVVSNDLYQFNFHSICSSYIQPQWIDNAFLSEQYRFLWWLDSEITSSAIFWTRLGFKYFIVKFHLFFENNNLQNCI